MRVEVNGGEEGEGKDTNELESKPKSQTELKTSFDSSEQIFRALTPVNNFFGLRVQLRISTLKLY